ncbi:MAG: HAMP domain-containing histidine kinase [Flavobacteriaceae bacterium]|nr:HAMP domain-containing histidine kinase [Flavobacteriaceae bacterium]
MRFNKSSLRTRIFIAMIFLVVIASVLIAAITIYQYNEQAEDYHNNRLERKEEAIKSAITYELQRNTAYALETQYLSQILDKKLNEISDIHNLDINIYDLKGQLLRSSHVRYIKDTTNLNLSQNTIDKISQDPNHRLVQLNNAPDGKKFKSSYTYLLDSKFKPIGIIGVPYLQDNTFQDEELREFLIRLSIVYVLILGIGIMIAYFLSKFITKPLVYVTENMHETALDKTNKKIVLEDASEEINNLVNSYNSMIDQIEDSAVKLAQIERKSAWREMAKQVAHEIKNPLTPMRLTVQSFEHNFDPNDPDIRQKLHEYSESLIQQIDTMSSIASAFSNFAQMPNQKRENLNVIEEVKKDLDIFQEPYINFYPEKEEIIAKLDKIQLTRVVTNLITNAIHAQSNKQDSKIDVRVFEKNNNVIIEVEDNGYGISKDDAPKIFEPKFTTKSSGMGLGLPIVKNIIEAYNGSITFESKFNEGTIFTVTLPKG